MAQSHYGDSPYPPPATNDTTFVVDTGPYLDTGCTFRSGGPLVIDLPVTLAYANVIAQLKAEGLVGTTVQLIMPAYDVDFSGDPSCNCNPERDQVYFNDHLVPGAYLTGANNTWVQNTFSIPIEWVNFPQPALRGGTVVPADNVIKILIDTANVGEEDWCTSIDWVALSLGSIPLPTVFVHGILSNGGAWNESGSDNDGTELQSFIGGCAVNGLVADNGLNMGSLDSIGNNAGKIRDEVDIVSAQYGVHRVNLVCHSKGGLDAREYVELLAGGKVFQLIQLGTPNGGSPLANAIQRAVFAGAGLWGGIAINGLVAIIAGPAGIQLTTPYMAVYNYWHGFNYSVRYYAKAGFYHPGTGLTDDLVEKALSAITGDGDTVVPIGSVYALPGYIIGLPVEPSSGPDHQARHFGGFLGLSPMGLTGSPHIFNSILPLVRTEEPRSVGSSIDPFGGGVMLLTTGAALAPGQTITNFVGVDQSTPLSVGVMYPTGQVALTLVGPGGQRINAANSVGNTNVTFTSQPLFGGMFTLAVVLSPEVGTWSTELGTASAGVGTNSVPFLLTVSSSQNDTALTTTVSPMAVNTNQPVVVSARLASGSGPITNGTLTAVVRVPDGTQVAVALADDGQNGDLVSGDGIYTGRYTNSGLGGTYQVFVTAGKPASGGQGPISREDFAIFSVVRPSIALSAAISDRGEDTDGNGLYNWLDVTIGLNVASPGTYLVRGELGDTNGNVHVASTRASLGTGAASVLLRFYGNAIRSNQVNGPFTLTSVRVAAEVDPDILPELEATNVYKTSAYRYTEFEGAQLAVVGTPTVESLDTNTNGLFDELRISVNVSSTVGGGFNGSMRLVDANSSFIGAASVGTSLNVGTNTVVFVFSGVDIGSHGTDGPYYARDLLLFNGAGASLALSDVLTVSNYLASQFEGFAGLGGLRLSQQSTITTNSLNRQTGLYQQTVTITNETGAVVSAAQIVVSGLAPQVSVYNAFGTNAGGQPFIQLNQGLPAGGSVTLVIEYYSSDRITVPAPVLTLLSSSVISSNPLSGTPLAVLTATVQPDGSVLLQFNAKPRKTYVVEYSSDMENWRQALPAIPSFGTRLFWADSGPPGTDSLPSTGRRFYRVLELP